MHSINQNINGAHAQLTSILHFDMQQSDAHTGTHTAGELI